MVSSDQLHSEYYSYACDQLQPVCTLTACSCRGVDIAALCAWHLSNLSRSAVRWTCTVAACLLQQACAYIKHMHGVCCACRWRHFDSAAMNERPDEPEDREKAFKPQFDVTGQSLHFHQDTGELHSRPADS